MRNKSTVCGTNARLKNVKKGALIQNYSFQSYVPCPATELCHDMQVFHVWC